MYVCICPLIYFEQVLNNLRNNPDNVLLITHQKNKYSIRSGGSNFLELVSDL